MNKIIFKHTGLPIPDMCCDIMIDDDRKLVTLALDHFDSALVITAGQSVEKNHEPIRLIDMESVNTTGPARIKHLYTLHLVFDERSHVARIMKMFRSDELTVSLTESHSTHAWQDRVNLKISNEITSRFSYQEICDYINANLDTWRAHETYSKDFDEWLDIVDSCEQSRLYRGMLSTADRDVLLRRSMPYLGMLDEQVVWRIKKGIP